MSILSMQKNETVSHKLNELADRLIGYLIYASVILVPLVVYPGASDQVLSIKYFLLKIIAIALAVLYVCKAIFNGVRVKTSGLELPITIFVLLLITATVLSVHVQTSLEGSYLRYDGFFSYLICVVLFFSASQYLSQKERFQIFTKLAILSATLVSIYGIAQWFGFDPVPWGFIAFDMGRSFSTFGNPILLGGYLSLMFPLSVGLFLGGKSMTEKIPYSISSTAIGLGLAATMGRAAWLGTLLGLFAVMVVFVKKRSTSMRISLSPVAVVMVIAIFALLVLGVPSLSSRATSILSLDGSTISRLLMWSSAIKMISDEPLFGFGPDALGLSFSKYESLELARVTQQDLHDNVHNAFLQMTATSGIPALLAYLVILVTLLIKATRYIKEETDISPALIGLFGGVIAFIAQSITGVTGIASSAFLWLSMGSLAASYSTERFEIRPLQGWVRNMAIAVIIVMATVGITSSKKTFLSDVYLGQARLAEHSGDILTAESIYKTAIKYSPGDDKAYRDLGIMMADIGASSGNSGLWSNGIGYLNDAVKLSPYSQKNLSSLGLGYLYGARVFNKNYYGDSEKYLKRSLEIRPYSPDARAMLGVVYLETGLLNRAKQNLSMALDVSQRDPQAHYHMGRYYERLGREDEAMKEYFTVLQLDRSHARAKESYRRLAGEKN